MSLVSSVSVCPLLVTERGGGYTLKLPQAIIFLKLLDAPNVSIIILGEVGIGTSIEGWKVSGSTALAYISHKLRVDEISACSSAEVF